MFFPAETTEGVPDLVQAHPRSGVSHRRCTPTVTANFVVNNAKEADLQRRGAGRLRPRSAERSRSWRSSGFPATAAGQGTHRTAVGGVPRPTPQGTAAWRDPDDSGSQHVLQERFLPRYNRLFRWRGPPGARLSPGSLNRVLQGSCAEGARILPAITRSPWKEALAGPRCPSVPHLRPSQASGAPSQGWSPSILTPASWGPKGTAGPARASLPTRTCDRGTGCGLLSSQDSPEGPGSGSGD